MRNQIPLAGQLRAASAQTSHRKLKEKIVSRTFIVKVCWFLLALAAVASIASIVLWLQERPVEGRLSLVVCIGLVVLIGALLNKILIARISRVNGRKTLDGSRRASAVVDGFDEEPCEECGQYMVIRNGTCRKCMNCGCTTGCS